MEGFLHRRQLDLLKIYVAGTNDIKLIRIHYDWIDRRFEDLIEYIETTISSNSKLIADQDQYKWINEPLNDDVKKKYIINQN